jgi:hypothetical protein
MNTKFPDAPLVTAGVDIREQLVNGGECGVVTDVSKKELVITRIRGILLDLDLPLFANSWLVPTPPSSGKDFYEQHVRSWLDNHPVLSKAEVRFTGNGLHVLLMLDQPIELKDEADRKRWAARVRIIQAILPIDPDQPGITATTRAVGSTNGKNGKVVELLRESKGITEVELLEVVEQLIQAPFATVFQVLAGRSSISPCPICGKGSTLDALEKVGKCYGGCGEVGLGQLFGTILKPREPKEVANA